MLELEWQWNGEPGGDPISKIFILPSLSNIVSFSLSNQWIRLIYD